MKGGVLLVLYFRHMYELFNTGYTRNF